MKRKLAIAGAAVLAAAASILVSVQPADAAVGLHVSGRNIVEANGQTFIMRGVNHAHVWFTNQTSSFADIKALGANTVRVVLGSGKRWGPSTDVANVISLCKQNRLICVLEVHDTTGYGEEGAAASLDEAVDYWISQKSALVGQENYVVINIGNEPIGNTNAGPVDRRHHRRDPEDAHATASSTCSWSTRRTGARTGSTSCATTRRPCSTPTPSTTPCCRSTCTTSSTPPPAITDYLDRFQTNGWPLVIGEFGWQPPTRRGRRDDPGRGEGPRPRLPGLVLERQHRPDTWT